MQLAARADGLADVAELRPGRSVRWELLSGPAPVRISDRGSLNPTVSCSAVGTYDFGITLRGPDGTLATSTTTVWIDRDPRLEAKLTPKLRAMLVDAGVRPVDALGADHRPRSHPGRLRAPSGHRRR